MACQFLMKDFAPAESSYLPTGTCQSNPVEDCRNQITPYHYSCVGHARLPDS